jgi:hypothetical protein
MALGDGLSTQPSNLTSLALPINIISSSPQKWRDIITVVGQDKVSWTHHEPEELQASKELDRLRMLGEDHYAYIARESALQKFGLIQKSRDVILQGDTIVDSTLWIPWWDGLPGLNAAQMYATIDLPDGTVKRSEETLRITCAKAAEHQDRRVYWIETAVTAECQEDGSIAPKVRQRVGLCFVPETPYVTGPGMWPITCPHPIRLAEARGNAEAVTALSRIQDSKWEFPQAAAKMGLLVPYAALQREEAIRTSPRGELFSSWVTL